MTSRFAPLRDARRRVVGRVARAGALVWALAPVRAGASDALELEWHAPPSCPQAGAVQKKLEAIVAEAPHASLRLRAQGRIERLGGRYRLTLSVRDGDTV